MSDSFHKYIQVIYLFNFLKCEKAGMAPHDKGYGCEQAYILYCDMGQSFMLANAQKLSCHASGISILGKHYYKLLQ
jgi:hypothetical protein